MQVFFKFPKEFFALKYDIPAWNQVMLRLPKVAMLYFFSTGGEVQIPPILAYTDHYSQPRGTSQLPLSKVLPGK
ncbi:hypothetical protein SY88_11745 [Clostridiales bacterium PH28_bin88]|nr:hypothetical protein SY88_11745 [Clostridiales bacterium PH28_bin88]